MDSTINYKMGEKLFLDIWNRWGSPSEISNNEEINAFLNELMTESDGLVNLDHFSHINFDFIKYIKYKKPYTFLYWKDFDELRKKYLEGNLTEDEGIDWQIHDFANYSYMLLHINKLKFVKIKDHLFILFLMHLIPKKKIKKFLIGPNDELIFEDDNKDDLYNELDFYEGKKEELNKHICFVNNLPYCTCLIQPKENHSDTLFSRKLLLVETLVEIQRRMVKVHKTIREIYEYEYDDLYAQGNTIRRILEYTLKFFCLFKEIEIKIDEKYGYIKLGELKKEINKSDLGIEVKQELVNIANEMSHDSGVVFSKDELFSFWKDVMELIKSVKLIIMESNK
ncbi:hypothetical protein ACQVPI_22495 [Bacillus wiedmannii]|uniref:hypothetical protein n=1 Tax=Bacillus wiedmannii TaxID=1890302 RepID=UPI003D6467B7